MNVGMPVFTIHGNHDDPAGEENLSAVSILSSAGLVNYFGKQVSQPAGWPGQCVPGAAVPVAALLLLCGLRSVAILANPVQA